MANKPTVLIVTLNKHLKDAIKDIAEKTGESQGSVVRQAIRDRMEKEGYTIKRIDNKGDYKK